MSYFMLLCIGFLLWKPTRILETFSIAFIYFIREILRVFLFSIWSVNVTIAFISFIRVATNYARFYILHKSCKSLKTRSCNSVTQFSNRCAYAFCVKLLLKYIGQKSLLETNTATTVEGRTLLIKMKGDTSKGSFSILCTTFYKTLFLLLQTWSFSLTDISIFFPCICCVWDSESLRWFWPLDRVE